MNETKYREALRIFAEACSADEQGDFDKAIEMYKSASKMGFTPALINLGNIYDDKISPPSPGDAVRCYKLAVSQGDGMGAYSLSVHYKNKGNRRWYEYWLRRSAAMGYDDAVDELPNIDQKIVRISRR